MRVVIFLDIIVVYMFSLYERKNFGIFVKEDLTILGFKANKETKSFIK